jgi:hypothetical protein
MVATSEWRARLTDEVEIAGSDGTVDELVPVAVAGERIYVSARRLKPHASADAEVEISSQRATLEQALGGLANVAQELGAKLRNTGASKVSVEFGCEFAFESGTLLAVVGKASAKSAFNVGLEWTAP